MTRQAVKDLALAATIAFVTGFISAVTTGDVGQAALAGFGSLALVVAKALNPADSSYGVGAGK